VITAKLEKELLLVFPKEIKQFRLKLFPKDKGRSVKSGESILIQKNDTIYLDRFQK
jgi:hypothetical protein